MYSKCRLIDVFIDNYTALSKSAIMIVRDKDAALDVMQNVALVIAKKTNHATEALIAGRIKKPHAFLLTCVRRAVLNYLRDESRVRPTDPAVLEEIRSDKKSHAAMEYLEWVMMLDKYLECYSKELRDAFIRYYVDGCLLDTLANELGMTPNALAQQFRRMRMRLASNSHDYRALLIILSFM